MSRNFIKFRLVILLSVLLSSGVQGQNPRFVYIQSQDKQPFYVKIDKNSFHSSETGYVLIPKLTENVYQLTIGFPKNEWPEQDARINLADTSVGYFLKRSESLGWSLVNLQELGFEKMDYSGNSGQDFEIIPIGGEFARILAEVVNDSSIAWKTVVRAGPAYTKQAYTKQPNTANEPLGLNNYSIELITDKQPDSMVSFEPIEKVKADTTDRSLSLTYIDQEPPGRDTIRIIVEAETNREYIVPDRTQGMDSIAGNTGFEKTDSRFIDMELRNPNTNTGSGKVDRDFVITDRKQDINNTIPGTNDIKGEGGGSVMFNSDCRSHAAEPDFLELRKQMASRKSEKDMIKTASRQFGKLCFTTGQVKNLGVLFISEAEKLEFYKAAFPHISDSQNFKTLEEQFSDSEYRIRFKALLGN